MDYFIRTANEDDIKRVVKFIDSTFTKEGYGFVTSSQIRTETKRGSVWIAYLATDDSIIGVRIGIDRVYNLAVHPAYRNNGVGRALLLINPPTTIRVKSQPVGNLSKEQLRNFRVPDGFYEAVGYDFQETDYARNFWQRGKKGERAHYHKQGKVKHIRIYKRNEDKL